MKKHPTPKHRKAAASLVLNSATAPTLVSNRFNAVTFSANASLVRNDEMEGKKYTVVPMVMMREGVLNGSNGPLFYPADELSKTPEVWNQKPVIVYHQSTKSGKGVGACHPDVLTTHKIGVIMNAQWDAEKNRLTAEAWLDPERVKEVDVRVHNAIKNKKVMELSTGLFTDNETSEGEHDGKPYVAIARNYRPDHLAVLPDIKGACSVADGAGFIRNELHASFPELDAEDRELLRDQVIKSLQTNKSPAVRLLITNEASHEQTRQALYSALEKRFPLDKGFCCPWIEAVFDDRLIYCMGGKLFSLGYSMTKTDGVKLANDPSEVVRVTDYRPAVTSNATPSTPNNNQKGDTMKKEQMVADLITNHGYNEADRSMLMGLDDATVARMHSAATLTANAAAAKKVEPAKVEPVKPAENAAPALSDADRAALEYGKTVLAQNRAALIATITANAANKFTKEQLDGMPIQQLEGIAAFATNAAPVQPAAPVLNYGGLAPVPTLATNSALTSKDALVAPGLDFTKK